MFEAVETPLGAAEAPLGWNDGNSAFGAVELRFSALGAHVRGFVQASCVGATGALCLEHLHHALLGGHAGEQVTQQLAHRVRVDQRRLEYS